MRGIGATRRQLPVAAATAIGLLLVLFAAEAGPVHLLRGGRVTFFHPHGAEDSPASPPHYQAHGWRRPPVASATDLGWLGDLLTWTSVVALCLIAAWAGLWLWRRRPHWSRRTTAAGLVEVGTEALPDLQELTDALAAATGDVLAVLDDGSPREGIVRCWLRLEEAIAAKGLPRAPAETSSEFTVRVLHALDLDPRAIGGLAALYREARFSDHQLDEPARTTARGMLDRLRDDLAVSTAARVGGDPR